MKKGLKLSFALMIFTVISSCTQQEVENTSHSNMNIQKASMDVAKDYLKYKYPNLSEIEWSSEGDNFEAEFEIDGIEYSTEFDKEGQWILTETPIEISEFPQTAVDAIKSTYPGYEIDEVESVESAVHGKVFEVEIESEDLDIEKEIMITADGKILKEEIEESGKEDNDNNES